MDFAVFRSYLVVFQVPRHDAYVPMYGISQFMGKDVADDT